jgi:FixJ family two-component response regulator
VLAESGGAAGFLNKPVDRAALLGAVSKTLETGTSWS